MDFLDNILKGMDKPPSIKKPEIKDKEKREKYEKMKKERAEAARKQKEIVDKFRKDIEKRVKDFVQLETSDSDPKTQKMTFKPMEKLYRTIIREICDEYLDDIVIHTFGTEDVDRHCVIWKKFYEPCEQEIRCMKLGVEYKDPSNLPDDDDEEDDDDERKKNPAAKEKFIEKYEEIFGSETKAGVDSAVIPVPAKQYGSVPVEHKKDQRTIEQVMEDMRKSKKQKLDPPKSDDPES